MESPSSKADVRRWLVFRVGQLHHEIEADRVLEVVKVGHITRVPNGPAALEGIANLRGQPLPVLSMRRILRDNDGAPHQDGRIIVYDHEGAIGLLVDDVLKLSDQSSEVPLEGLSELLDVAFKTARRAPVSRTRFVDRGERGQASVASKSFLAFRVAGHLYGLPLEHVREVATMPSEVSVLADGREACTGLMSLHDSVLPLMSLDSLLGLQINRPAGGSPRIVVVHYGGGLVGIVVDEMDVIYRLPEQAIDAVPVILQRGRGGAQIEAIGRIGDGEKLISILSPEKLCGHTEIEEIIDQKAGAMGVGIESDTPGAVEQFLIFQLGQESYGLPIASVDEVIQVPINVTRIPGAPAFVTGMINLRGRAVPLIDQKSRFESPAFVQTGKTRAIVVTIGKVQAGFVVDSVSEVKAIPTEALSAAPEFSTEQTDVFDRIAHIEADGRMLLLINPQELLVRAEQDVIAMIADSTAELGKKAGGI